MDSNIPAIASFPKIEKARSRSSAFIWDTPILWIIELYCVNEKRAFNPF